MNSNYNDGILDQEIPRCTIANDIEFRLLLIPWHNQCVYRSYCGTSMLLLLPLLVEARKAVRVIHSCFIISNFLSTGYLLDKIGYRMYCDIERLMILRSITKKSSCVFSEYFLIHFSHETLFSFSRHTLFQTRFILVHNSLVRKRHPSSDTSTQRTNFFSQANCIYREENRRMLSSVNFCIIRSFLQSQFAAGIPRALFAILSSIKRQSRLGAGDPDGKNEWVRFQRMKINNRF